MIIMFTAYYLKVNVWGRKHCLQSTPFPALNYGCYHYSTVCWLQLEIWIELQLRHLTIINYNYISNYNYITNKYNISATISPPAARLTYFIHQLPVWPTLFMSCPFDIFYSSAARLTYFVHELPVWRILFIRFPFDLLCSWDARWPTLFMSCPFDLLCSWAARLTYFVHELPILPTLFMSCPFDLLCSWAAAAHLTYIVHELPVWPTLFSLSTSLASGLCSALWYNLVAVGHFMSSFRSWKYKSRIRVSKVSTY